MVWRKSVSISSVSNKRQYQHISKTGEKRGGGVALIVASKTNNGEHQPRQHHQYGISAGGMASIKGVVAA
jgi:hypothetical protein